MKLIVIYLINYIDKGYNLIIYIIIYMVSQKLYFRKNWVILLIPDFYLCNSVLSNIAKMVQKKVTKTFREKLNQEP